MTNKLTRVADVHICNEEDWSKFHRPAYKSLSTFTKLKQRNVLYCFNKLDKDGKPFADVKLFGPDDTSINRHIEIILKPCIPGVKKCSNEQTLTD